MTDDNITFLMQVKGVTAGVTVFVAFLTIFGVVKTFPYLVEYIGRSRCLYLPRGVYSIGRYRVLDLPLGVYT